MNFFYFWLGLAVLIANKIRYQLFGYDKPRDFSVEQTKKALDYDFKVVDGWLKFLKEKFNEDVVGKRILDLGPGADLGPGLILLSLGAEKYHALDVNNLAQKSPMRLYDELFLRIGDKFKPDLEKALFGGKGQLNYVVRPDFYVKFFKNENIDLVFSQAAFEHFNSIPKTVKELSETVASGTKLIAEIDFKTHTGFLAKRDPLNIYRYSDFIYNILKFSGIPNRLKPSDYLEIFRSNGWEAEIVPLINLADDQFRSVKNSLAGRFRGREEMKVLSAVLAARKK